MLFKNITLIDANMEIQVNQYVAIKDRHIDYIGTLPPQGDYGTVYDGRHKLLIPGLVNAHAHTPMTLMRGYGENLRLQEWLNTKIFPFEALMNQDDVYYSYLLGVAEMVRFGVVSTTDMYYYGHSMAQAVLDSGFKSNLGLSVTVFDDREYAQLPIYQEIQSLVESYHKSGNGRVLIDMSLHAEYTSTPKVVQAVAAHGAEMGLRMHVHLSETKQEHEDCKNRNQGRTPTSYFRDMEVFDCPTTAAHCIWLEEKDFSILADKGVTIATNPVSNLKLASGICNVPLAMEHHINIALGTDSVASNNNLNLFEEMKLHGLIHKNQSGDPTVITPAEAFAAATINGARSQGREEMGQIKIGALADLAVLNLNQPHLYPVHDLLNNLVYASLGSDVCLTMVEGRVLYEEGQYPTLDLERIYYEMEKTKQRILRSL